MVRVRLRDISRGAMLARFCNRSEAKNVAA
jgi:hypothetical protein